jgi:GT2 family glycosyltransferase
VSVIVPFAGSDAQLARLLGDLDQLAFGEDDEVIVADNRGASTGTSAHADPRILVARGIRSPGFARNQAARRARGTWLVFIDADTTPSASLLDDYFDPRPDSSTGILAGAITDLAERPTLAARHSAARGHMSQRTTLGRPGSPYAQTANCAVLRSAFDAVAGFEQTARAGEDADLCFRLAQAGWKLEPRTGAAQPGPSALVQRSRDFGTLH